MAINTEKGLDINELAKELGVQVERTRQILNIAKKAKISIIAKKAGPKLMYTPQTVKDLVEFKNKGGAGIPREKSSKVLAKSAKLFLQVPIFDQEIAEVLRQAFGSDEAIVRFLKTYLEDTVRPILAKKRKLEAESAKQLQKELEIEFSKHKRSVG